jgi:flagellar protein FliS
MLTDATEIYLETQINTATPQRLRLMLIEGAIRFARRTQDLWRESVDVQALEALVRCRDIVGELLAGVSVEESPLTTQVGNLYGYLLSALAEIQYSRDEHQLAAVIRVLEEERETWRQLCEQVPDRLSAAPSAAFAPREDLAPAIAARSEAFSIDA